MRVSTRVPELVVRAGVPTFIVRSNDPKYYFYGQVIRKSSRSILEQAIDFNIQRAVLMCNHDAVGGFVQNNTYLTETLGGITSIYKVDSWDFDPLSNYARVVLSEWTAKLTGDYNYAKK